MRSTLYHTVEIIGIYSILALNSSHAKSLTQVVWNKRHLMTTFGELAFIRGKKYDMLKVQVTCLEHAHHLQSDGWLAMEWNGSLLHHPLHEAYQCA